MQHTLLGLGIALILALVTALAGPLLIDWGSYRASFESEAGRMSGLPVRIGGAIDVRILPTPTIVLRDVEVGSRAAPVFGAHGRVVAALGVSGPVSRLKPARMKALRAMVAATAAQVSRRLGAPGGQA